MIHNIPLKYKTWIEFGLLALIIMLPLLLPGYILTLDLVFTPHMAWPNMSPSFPLEVMLWIAYKLLPGDTIEKIILFGVLIISGVSMFKLMQRITPPKSIQPQTWRLAAYIASIFYMVNPFLYARFMAGQWMILLGYAFLPFFLKACLAFLRRPGRKTSLVLAGWAISIGVISVHFIGIMLLAAVGMMAVVLVYDRSNLKQYALWGIVGVSVWLIANLYWLIPLIAGGSIAPVLAGFDTAHFEAFATAGGFLNVLQLQGFWAETRQLFILPQQLLPLWGIIVLILWGILIFGVIKLWQSGRKRLVVTCVVGIGGAIVLASTPLIIWISKWLPFVAGYREPHKFVVIVVIGYAIFLACGAAYIIQAQKAHSWQREAIIAGLFLLPVLLTPTMFGGFAGQLVPRAYPPEWYTLNQSLKHDKSVQRVLFLPWHQYANYSFSGRLIANPAEKFFEFPVVISDEPEFKAISPTEPNEDKRRLSEALSHKNLPLELLHELGISHIILAKEQEWREYSEKVSTVASCRLENDKLLVYKVKDNAKR